MLFPRPTILSLAALALTATILFLRTLTYLLRHGIVLLCIGFLVCVAVKVVQNLTSNKE